ncbi:hypothetical protein LAZ67_2002797 [Cordylochernes scorpioides]|uniref:Uncharacterized protein n=1 Tax=Cordylochernes scorpioides TaxID=51811 RepID=A0ABY6K6Y1_9ARAC|nr:hypothetical protein LAZ67_2002797 [Cordylochernes scorpioides]
MPPMSGPFTILKQIPPVNYEIDKPQSNLGKTTMVIYSSKLRPYYPKEGFELKLTKSKIPTLEKKPNQQVAPKTNVKTTIPSMSVHQCNNKNPVNNQQACYRLSIKKIYFSLRPLPGRLSLSK